MLVIDRESLKPFFERVPELFQQHHHDASQDAMGYEELLYRIHRPFTNEMLDVIDEWMGLEQQSYREEDAFRLHLFLLAIRYPDTLLLESLDEVLLGDIKRLSGYLHFTKHTYSIWDEDTRKGLMKLGLNIPETGYADAFIYGSYCASIELIKDLAPFYSFIEHDVPRQRLFQAALASFGRE
jgi:hypothetical protein